MAIITCPECGRQISEYAPACVGCGVPMEMIKMLNAEIDLSPESTSAVAENKETVPQDQPINSEFISADQMKSRITSCIICGTDFDITDYHCPKCNFSVLSLSPQPDSNLISSLQTKYRGEIDLTKPLLTRVYTYDEYTKICSTVSVDTATGLASEYEKRAEQGNFIAKANLGVLYYIGYGVKKDYSNALELLNDATKRDVLGAHFWLGLLYEYGQGVEKDYAKAAEWFRKAAEQGYAEAQYSLGVLYAQGLGVKQDYARAAKLYQKAADQGHTSAQFNLGVLYEEGLGVEKDLAKAIECHSKAAGWDDAELQNQLGILYSKGQRVEQDITKAAECFHRAAEQGYAEAQNNLGRLYEYHFKDYTKAMEWYLKAAEQGYAEAQNNLGRLYELGAGVEQNYTKAAEWYRKAADQGDEEAADILAELNKRKGPTSKFKK